MKRACCVLAILVVACGGGGNVAHTADTASATPAAEREAAHTEETPPAAEPAPTALRCADETCFACGTGFCLRGFFCDEGAKGGAACSWLPACPKGATCDCLKRALGSCACQMESGGAHVRCE